MDPHDAEKIDRLKGENTRLQQLSGRANYLLARIVAAANRGAIDGDDGFIESYNLPVGPIHRAIPFLQEQGIHVTNNGEIHSATSTGANE